MSTSKVRVEIDYEVVKKYAKGGQTHEAIYINDALRKAGVPVVGVLGFMAVERGRLTMQAEQRGASRMFIYEYECPLDVNDEDEL